MFEAGDTLLIGRGEYIVPFKYKDGKKEFHDSWDFYDYKNRYLGAGDEESMTSNNLRSEIKIGRILLVEKSCRK